METFKVLFPTNWDGCELHLMKLNTEKDNPYFRNNDIVVAAMLPENKIKLYLKDGDLVCLEREKILAILNFMFLFTTKLLEIINFITGLLLHQNS